MAVMKVQDNYLSCLLRALIRPLLALIRHTKWFDKVKHEIITMARNSIYPLIHVQNDFFFLSISIIEFSGRKIYMPQNTSLHTHKPCRMLCQVHTGELAFFSPARSHTCTQIFHRLCDMLSHTFTSTSQFTVSPLRGSPSAPPSP